MKKKYFVTLSALTVCLMSQSLMAQTKGEQFVYDGKTYQVVGENLINNPSFEDGFTSWTSANDFTSTLSDANFDLLTDGAQDGNFYLKGIINDGTNGVASIGTAWNIEAGKTYVYSYYIKALGTNLGTGYVKSSLTNKKGDETKVFATPVLTESGVWTHYQVVFTNSEGYQYCQAKFRWLAGQWGFDNFVLAEVVQVVSKTILTELISKAEGYYGDGTGKNAATLLEAINAAKRVNDKVDATIEDVEAAEDALELAIYNYSFDNASEDNPCDVTAVYVVNNSFESDFNGWVNNSMARQGNKTFVKTDGAIYVEKWSDEKNLPIGDCSVTQTICVPEGKYKLVAAAQNILQSNSEAAQTGASVFVGDNKTVVTQPDDYVVEFTSIGENLSIGFKAEGSTGNYMCCDNFRLYKVGEADNSELQALWLAKLNEVIAEAEALNNGANVGDGAFKIPESAQTTLAAAIENAKGAISSSDVETMKTSVDNLRKAIETYQSQTLNAPVDGKRYNIILSTVDNQVWVHNGKALTFVYGGQTAEQNDYAINYAFPANANMAQAFMFEKAEGVNNGYIIYFEDNAGETRYICDGSVTGAGTGSRGIRTTLEKTKALVFEIIATSVEGNYKLKNTVVNDYMGSQDAGFFTVNSHSNFNLQEAQELNVTLSQTEWATLMLPFNAALPEGMKAYTANGVNESVIEMEEVDALQANVPYIVEVTAENVSLNGYGLGIQETYTSGLLTGVYVNTTAIEGTYVLQNQPEADGIAFYRVGSEIKPSVKANRAYLQLPSSEANVRVITLPGDADGVETVDAADVQVDVYTMSGIRVRSNVKKSEALNGLKGVYILKAVK